MLLRLAVSFHLGKKSKYPDDELKSSVSPAVACVRVAQISEVEHGVALTRLRASSLLPTSDALVRGGTGVRGLLKSQSWASFAATTDLIRMSSRWRRKRRMCVSCARVCVAFMHLRMPAERKAVER